MPPWGGSRVMHEDAFLLIMMSNVSPDLLRTCQRSTNHNDDDILLRRELSGRSLKKDISISSAASKVHRSRSRRPILPKDVEEASVNEATSSNY
ncbi:MAG: hypothetical protein LUO85_00225 [Methanomassiliicoccales archaeon]|nr:hypothetical protein [Methanomassiliicoccales archaeon]